MCVVKETAQIYSVQAPLLCFHKDFSPERNCGGWMYFNYLFHRCKYIVGMLCVLIMGYYGLMCLDNVARYIIIIYVT